MTRVTKKGWRALLLVVTVGMSSAAANDASGNAALVYWQAFDGLKDVNTQDYQRAMSTPLDESLDKKFVDICDSSHHSLKLMHRAGRRSYCDWGIDLHADGAEAVLPHLALARGLARVGLLRARQHFFHGNHETGVADVLAVIAMGRYAGRDRSLVGLLVNHGIERMAHQVAAAYIPRFSEPALSQLATGLARLPAMNSFAECMATEGEFLAWFRRRVATTSTDQELGVLAAALGVEESQLLGKGGRDAIIQHTDNLAKSYQVLPAIVHRPESLQTSPFKDVMQEAGSNPVGAIFFPALDRAWHTHRRFACYDAMFRAGLSVVRRGEGTLEYYVDPTDGSKFQMRKLEEGFELTSDFSVQPNSNQKVRLVFGKLADG